LRAEIPVNSFAFKILLSCVSAPAKIVFEQKYIQGDSRTSRGQWNELCHSPEGLLKANSAYRISFYYEVIARAHDANFYARRELRDRLLALIPKCSQRACKLKRLGCYEVVKCPILRAL